MWDSNYSEYQKYLFNRICRYKDKSVTPIGYRKISQIFNEDGLKTPYVLGYHRCQYVDRYNEKNNLLKQGMIKNDGSPYGELVNVVAATNRTAKELFELSRQ